MTGYLFVLLATCCFSGMFAFSKQYGKTVRQTNVTASVLAIGNALLGMIIFMIASGFQIRISGVSVFFAVLQACVTVPCALIGIKVLTLGSLAVYSMFMMLGGMLVPFFYGILFLQEEITPGKAIGTLLMTVFIVLQAFGKTDKKAENAAQKKGVFFLLCILIFFLNGSGSVVIKAHQISAGAVDSTSYTVLACAASALLATLILCFFLLKNKAAACADFRLALRPVPLFLIAMVGAFERVGGFFNLSAASTVPASIQFPLVSGGVIAFSALVSVLIFKEKLSKKEWISVTGAFLSTVLFAF